MKRAIVSGAGASAARSGVPLAFTKIAIRENATSALRVRWNRIDSVQMRNGWRTHSCSRRPYSTNPAPAEAGPSTSSTSSTASSLPPPLPPRRPRVELKRTDETVEVRIFIPDAFHRSRFLILRAYDDIVSMMIQLINEARQIVFRKKTFFMIVTSVAAFAFLYSTDFTAWLYHTLHKDELEAHWAGRYVSRRVASHVVSCRVVCVRWCVCVRVLMSVLLGWQTVRRIVPAAPEAIQAATARGAQLPRRQRGQGRPLSHRPRTLTAPQRPLGATSSVRVSCVPCVSRALTCHD